MKVIGYGHIFKSNLSNGPSAARANFKQFNSCLTPMLADYLSQGMDSVKFAYSSGNVHHSKRHSMTFPGIYFNLLAIKTEF